jgi:hypothetical protein
LHLYQQQTKYQLALSVVSGHDFTACGRTHFLKGTAYLAAASIRPYVNALQ